MDEKKEYSKFKRKASEPVMILGIMDRHPNWAALIALIADAFSDEDSKTPLKKKTVKLLLTG